MYQLLRPFLFALDPETSHHLTMQLLKLAGDTGLSSLLLPKRVSDPVELMGCKFANRVGLAAGLDKDAMAVKGLQDLGFGFLEVGTVTPLAQPGNAKPRMFRLPEHEAIINRMGFNNAGMEAMALRIHHLRRSGLSVPLGINIGKNKDTKPLYATNDYIQCLKVLALFADYVTINLSSPNTPGLRDMQFGEQLDELLQALSDERKRIADQSGRYKPLLVKIAPDMADDDLLHVADKLVHYGIDGVIATNTTIKRDSVAGHKYAEQAGGLSGSILFDPSTAVVKTLADHLQGELVIVGVGGIHQAQQALDKITAGADLVQIYSGLIYHGPALIKRSANLIKQSLAEQ